MSTSLRRKELLRALSELYLRECRTLHILNTVSVLARDAQDAEVLAALTAQVSEVASALKEAHQEMSPEPSMAYQMSNIYAQLPTHLQKDGQRVLRHLYSLANKR